MTQTVQKYALTNNTEVEEWRQILYAEVYAPMVLDTHGDYMTAESIEGMAHNFLKDGYQRNIDVMHDGTHVEACIVESFIARQGDPDFTPLSWVVGIHIENEDLWQKVLNGELNGLSLEALAQVEEQTVSLTIPDLVEGLTSTDNNHRHTFRAVYNDEGEFVGGVTNEVDGHVHTISHATYTDTEEFHNHKFDSVSGFFVTKT